jgi:Chaperone for flagella basal body P-ring formation
MFRRITLLLAIPIFGGLLPRADCATSAFPISRESIAKAIQTKLHADTTAPVSIEAGEILFSVVPEARVPLPHLALASISSVHDGFFARIRCVPASDCLPFLVLLQLDGQSRENILQSEAKKRAMRSGPVLIPAGSRVKLTLKRGDVNLRIEVRSLNAGRLGQRIRVSDDVARKVYIAHVTGAGVVEADY